MYVEDLNKKERNKKNVGNILLNNLSTGIQKISLCIICEEMFIFDYNDYA